MMLTDPSIFEVTVNEPAPNAPAVVSAVCMALADTDRAMLSVVFVLPETRPDKLKLPGINVPPEMVESVCVKVSVGAFETPAMLSVPFEFEVTVKVPVPNVLLSVVWRRLADTVREILELVSAVVNAPDRLPVRVKLRGLSVPFESVTVEILVVPAVITVVDTLPTAVKPPL